MEHSDPTYRQTQQELLQQEQQLVESLSSESGEAVVSIHRRLHEIVRAMDVFSHKVAQQAEACLHIESLAGAALTNVEGAEVQLSTALRKHSTFHLRLAYLFLALGVLLVGLDFLKSFKPYLT